MEKQYYIRSTKYALQTRRTKKHGVVYDIVFRVTDKKTLKEIQKKISGFETKSAAKTAYTEFVTENCELARAGDVGKIDTARHTPTVKQLLDLYVPTLYNQNKESTIYDKDKVYKLFILPKYGDRKITDLTRDELYRWQDEIWTMRNRNGNPYSYAYLCKIRTFFSAFLTWTSTRYGYVNHLEEVKKPKRRAPKQKMRFWTRKEFDAFMGTVTDPMYHCLFTLLFFTGRRIGEILALTPEDIHKTSISFTKSVSRKTMDGSAYKITATKADKDQTIPVCPIVRREIENYCGQAPFYLSGDRPISDNTLMRYFRKHTEEAGVKQIRIHDLRHSFVSMLIHEGANLMVVADLIGDTVEQITKTYGHLYQEDKEKIVAKIV